MNKVSPFEESSTFTTLREFNKEYKELRRKIILRHGHSEESKVRLKGAIMMHINFGNGFLNYTTIMSDMKDKIKAYEGTKNDVLFKLSARV